MLVGFYFALYLFWMWADVWIVEFLALDTFFGGGRKYFVRWISDLLRACGCFFMLRCLI